MKPPGAQYPRRASHDYSAPPRAHATENAAFRAAVRGRSRVRCIIGGRRTSGARGTAAAAPRERQNGLVGRYLPSSVITAREPPSGSSTFFTSSRKLIALMMPSPNFSWTSAFSVVPYTCSIS